MIMEDHSPREKGRASRLNEEGRGRIHAASLEILERIGVRLDLPEAIDLLKAAGAWVTEDSLVHIPSGLVEQALASAPKQVTLYNRQGEPAMVLGRGQCYYGPGSDCLNIIDHRSGERRKPILKDVVEGAILCDALEDIDFVMSMVLPGDVDQDCADTFQAQAMLAHTSKPLLLVSYETGGLAGAVEMAEAVAGGERALCEKPILTCYINVVSGAVHNAAGLQKLLYLANKGLPAIYIPGSNAGVTSPASLAGAVALDNAGVMVGLVLSQLKRSGTPYIWSAMDSISIDMQTTVSPYGYPERGVMRAMAQHYGLPSFALAGGSDAKLVDQQAGIEAALTILADTMLGGEIIHDLGYLESGLTFSFAQLAICAEIVSWVKAFQREIDVSSEALALEVIEKVGPGGKYLAHPHTRRHYREYWYPTLFERGNYADWMQRGGLSLAERAARRVEQILEQHRPEPLPAEVQARLQEILRRKTKFV